MDIKTARRPSDLVRRFPDPDVPGRYVTYLVASKLAEIIGVSGSTISRWAGLGFLRVTDPIAGARNYSVVDAARLKMMTRAEAEERGISLMPEDRLRYNQRWRESAQYRTGKRAEYSGEEWDDYDVQFVVDCVAEGRRIEVIAKALGRTYDAVSARIEVLRESGDIPPAHLDAGWLERTRLILTEDEQALLAR